MGYGIVRAIPGERDCVRSHVNPPSQAQQRGGAGGSIETLHRSPKVNFLVNPTQLLLIFGDVMCPVIQKTLKNIAKRRGTTFQGGRHDFTHVHIFREITRDVCPKTRYPSDIQLSRVLFTEKRKRTPFSTFEHFEHFYDQNRSKTLYFVGRDDFHSRKHDFHSRQNSRVFRKKARLNSPKDDPLNLQVRICGAFPYACWGSFRCP